MHPYFAFLQLAASMYMYTYVMCFGVGKLMAAGSEAVKDINQIGLARLTRIIKAYTCTGISKKLILYDIHN